MPKQSAGILLYKKVNNQLEIFLVHPGGPFFKNKDDGAWSIPKGEFVDDEDALLAAKREFLEETGQAIDGNFIKLKPVKLKSGKTVYCWAVEGNIDHQNIISNTFEMEWPPRSGKTTSFAEVDRAGWFDLKVAKTKVNAAQTALINELESVILKD